MDGASISTLVFVLLFLSALLIGTLIGSVGVGGVLLAPALIYLAGFEPHVAMATSTWGFLFVGTVGTATYARRGTLDWSSAAAVSAGVVPAAVLGAWVNGTLSQTTLKLVLALLLVGTGLHTLSESATGRHSTRRLSAKALVAVGVGVGFGSALTGTGGAVLLVPTLLFLGVPALTTVGVSQFTAIPVAVFGTIGFLAYGEIDLLSGLWLGAVGSIGVLGGARIAHAAPAAVLRRGVAVAMVVAGIAIAGSTLAFLRT